MSSGRGNAALDINWHEVARRYEAGESGPELSREYGCAAKTIYRNLRRLGVEIRLPVHKRHYA